MATGSWQNSARTQSTPEGQQPGPSADTSNRIREDALAIAALARAAYLEKALQQRDQPSASGTIDSAAILQRIRQEQQFAAHGGELTLNANNNAFLVTPPMAATASRTDPPAATVAPHSGYIAGAQQSNVASGVPGATTAGSSGGIVSRKGIPHVYRDHSHIPDPSSNVRRKTGGVSQPFPDKLHEMLHAVSGDPEISKIVAWLPHGRAFLVRRPKEFAQDIMPKFFRQSKLTSFQRQLNLYGFRRITQGTDAGAYYHELFLRGRPGLCQRMVRQKVKGTGHKQPSDASSEPQFYNMPELPDIPPEGVQQDTADTISAPTAMRPAPAMAPAPHAAAVPQDIPSPNLQSLQGAAHLLRGIASSLAQLSAQQHQQLAPAPWGTGAPAPAVNYQGLYTTNGQNTLSSQDGSRRYPQSK